MNNKWQKVKVSYFLKNRESKIKPIEANKLSLKRLTKIDFSGNIHLDENKKTGTDMIFIKSGDLVISGINVEKGALAIYNGVEDILATIHYSAYEYDKNLIDIEYLKYFLKSNIFSNIIKMQTKGGIKTEIKPKIFLNLEINLPELDLQKEIVKKIKLVEEEISELCNINNDNEFLLSNLRKSILQEAMEGKLVEQDSKDEPAGELLKKIKEEKERLVKEKKIKKDKELLEIKDEEIPYKLPNGWVWCRLGDISEHNSGKTLDSGRNVGELRNYITTSNLYWGYFVLENLRQMPIKDSELEKITAKNGDLLICEGGESGRASVWKEDYNICFQNHIHRVRFYENINPYYIFRLFQKMNYTGEINLYRKGIGISNMSSKALSSIFIPLPPLNEQERIVEKVDELFKSCDELEELLNDSKLKSEKLMDSVLGGVFKE